MCGLVRTTGEEGRAKRKRRSAGKERKVESADVGKKDTTVCFVSDFDQQQRREREAERCRFDDEEEIGMNVSVYGGSSWRSSM